MIYQQNVVLIGLVAIICEIYLDDVLVFGKDEDEYFRNLETVFERLSKHKLTVNPDKIKCGLTEVEYVGHTISSDGMRHNRERIEKVLQIPLPTKQNDLKSFIGVSEYFHDHIKNCASILTPLQKLITPYNKFYKIKWTDEAIQAFENMKQIINDCPKLYFIDTHAPVYLHTDASKYAIGAYLFQVVDGKEQPQRK